MTDARVGRLGPKQWLQLHRLLERIEKHAGVFAPTGNKQPTRGISDWDWSNVFGLVGPRGSGKSTLLHALSDIMASAPPTGAAASGLEDRTRILASRLSESGIRVLTPIDCSALPEHVDPAAAVLLRVAADNLFRLPRHQADEGPTAKLTRQLRRLAGDHMKGSTSYRNLCIELSTTPEELPHYLIEGIEQRLDLQERLVKWFTSAANALKARCLVVLLDDFDLVPGPVVRRWLQALLDTLRQPRLVLVLTADLQRLEHVSADSRNQIDDSTGQALLLKLLPPLNRLLLEPVTHGSRLAFRPRYVSESDPDLGELLQACWDAWPEWQRSLFSGLMPSWPRGLVNLYQLLRADNGASHAGSACETGASTPAGRSASEEGGAPTNTWLSRLAACRGEPLLARRLRETSPPAWLKEMFDPEQRGECARRGRPAGAAAADSADITWQETVAAAATMAAPPRPLLALPPVPVVRRPRRPRDPLSRDPRWSDPLRHDFYRYDSLRDAQPEDDRALWAELMVNLALAESGTGAALAAEPLVPEEHFGSRHRAVLLARWAPLRVRSARACFRVEFSGSELARFFSSPPPLFDRAMLPWLRWDESETHKDRFTLAIGWSVLLRHLQGDARPWPARLLNTLRVAPGNLGGELLLPGPAEALRILPAEVRHLVLLVDALDRCPWETLSAPRLGWAPLTYLRLAAELVRAAYVSTLDRFGLVPEDVKRQHARLLGAISSLDPGFSRGGASAASLREIDVVRMLDDAQDKALRDALRGSAHSLGQAAAAFLDLGAYRALEQVSGTWV